MSATIGDRDRRLAYAKGYYAGSRYMWPEHRPPSPPCEIVADLMLAARNLRDGVDCELALFGEEDEIAKRLGPLIDVLDRGFARVSQWLKEN